MAIATLVRDRLAAVRPPPLWAVLLLVVGLHGTFVLTVGVTMATDSFGYARWSARLIESGFDYPTFIGEAPTTFPTILYVLFLTLLAVLRLVFGDGWDAALVVLNFATHVALGALIVRLAVRLTGSAAAGWSALLLYLICLDLLLWVPMVMSDATFVFLAFAIFTLAAARILGDARGWSAVLPPAALGIAYRPTGIVLLPDLAWAIYLSRTRRDPPRRVALAFAAILAAAVVALACAFAWLMQDPERWPFESLAGAFDTVARGYAIGEVVSARPETHHAPPRQLLDYVLISADRFVHFFAFSAAGFSAAHRLTALVFFLPCYALAAWLAVALVRGDTALGVPQRKVFLAAYGAVLSYAVFHGLVQVDFDWRYRLPILPHLILLAAGGAADLARRSTSAPAERMKSERMEAVHD